METCPRRVAASQPTNTILIKTSSKLIKTALVGSEGLRAKESGRRNADVRPTRDRKLPPATSETPASAATARGIGYTSAN